MTDDYERGYQDGRFDGYYDAVAMLEEEYRDSENLAAELRAALAELVRLKDGPGRSDQLLDLDVTWTEARRLAGGEEQE